MAKGIKSIIGEKNPKVGQSYTYEVSSYYPNTPRQGNNIQWKLYVMQNNGSWRELRGPLKIGTKAPFLLPEKWLGKKMMIEAFIYNPEKKSPPGLIITPIQANIPEIKKVELRYHNNSPGKVFSFSDKLIAQAICINLFNKELTATLWEDDAAGNGHYNKNNIIKSVKSKVDENGIAKAEFLLTEALIKKALEGEIDVKQIEFYVTFEYYAHKKHATNNIHVDNPISKNPSPPISPKADPPVDKTPPDAVPKQEPVIPTPENTSNQTQPTTSAQANGTIENTQPPAPPEPATSPAVVNEVKIENLLDAYFAKKDYTKKTGNEAGTIEYTFGGNGNNTDNDSKKENIAKIILGKPAVTALKDKKQYTTLEAIKAALTKDVYNKNEKISIKTFKLGVEFVKVNSAPLEEKLYLVARTSVLDGKQATLIIKEKDGIIKGSSGATLPVLEITEEQMEQKTTSGEVPGTEKTEFTGTVKDNLVKIPIHLRPKSDGELKNWKERLSKGKEDGTYTYTFSGITNIKDANEKRSIAGIILSNAKDGKKGNPKIENGKISSIEEIEKVLQIRPYGKEEKITFKLYKITPELLFINAKAQGDKQHNKEFLKSDGAYFEIGKKCICEEIIRAFLRTLRVGEGTGEIIKSRDKKTKEIIYIPNDFEKGYTTAFNGNLITDLSDHPRINYGGSTAAGAYQAMKDTWDDPQYSSPKKKYKINSFSRDNQDKFSVLLMKHHPGCSDLLGLLLSGQTENSIRGRASRIWASLPEKGDNSRYLFKGKPQPVTPMKTVLEHYEKFLNEELAGKSPLHLKKGFLNDFDITCNCSNSKGEVSVNEKWHNPLMKMELRGWYSATQWSPEKSDWQGRTGRPHDGLDLYAPVGTTTYACVSGKVADIYLSGTYGNTITIEGIYNGKTYYFFYAHLKYAAKFEIGNPIVAGIPIGFTGQTGNANGQASKMAHLHFEVRSANTKSKNKVNPNLITDMVINKNPNKNSQS